MPNVSDQKSSNSSHNSYTHRATKNFTIIENDLIRSPSLSCKAYKLLCIGLSHSGNWSFNKTQIATCFKEGVHTVEKAMKELRGIGYLHLKAINGPGGKMKGYHWFWFDKPISDEEFKKFHRDGAFPGTGENGQPVNQGALRRPSLKKTKDKEEKKERKKEVSGATPPNPPPPQKKKTSVKENKEKYGPDGLVLLTTLEHTSLQKEIGDKDVEAFIEELNGYIASTGKKYKSHYHTIQNWHRRNLKEGKSNGNNKKYPGKDRSNREGCSDEQNRVYDELF